MRLVHSEQRDAREESTRAGRAARLIAFLSLFVLAAGAEGATVESTRNLNLRECPSTRNCKVVLTVPARKTLEKLSGSQDGWLQVKTVPEGTVGWVYSRYVVPVATPPAPRPVEPIYLYPQGRGRLSTHVLTLLFLLGITLFSPIRRGFEKRTGQAPTQDPLKHLISDPKIVISWVILILAGIAGLVLLAKSSLPSTETLYIAQFFSYSGWAAFWGVRPCGRLWAKVAKKLILWTPMSLLGIALATIPIFFLSVIYAYWGGGIIHFFRHWWAVRRLHVQNSAPVTPNPGSPSVSPTV